MKPHVLTLLLIGTGVQAQSYDPDILSTCLLETGIGVECAGVAAHTCIENGGGSTAGMSLCYEAELAQWDGYLNHWYKALRAEEKRIATEPADPLAPSPVEALRDMQRAWIAYRDAACVYEHSTWGGGNGGGPAHASCMMVQTAQQAMHLKEKLDGYESQ